MCICLPNVLRIRLLVEQSTWFHLSNPQLNHLHEAVELAVKI